MTKTQKVQVQNMKHNPGILPFNLGTARIQIGTHTFLHYVETAPIQKLIENLTQKYYRFNKTISMNTTTPYPRKPLQNAYKQLEYEINNINQKFKSIFPMSHRQKRGLINPAGSLLKFFTGNMDQEDANKIYDSISQLEKSQNKIISKVNKQISLSSHIITTVNESLSIIDRNQNLIKIKIENLQRAMNESFYSYAHYFEIQEILIQMKFNSDSLLNFVTDLENAISFAALKTLHHSIVNPENLRKIISDLYSFHNHDQILFSQDEFLKYYAVVETTAFSAQDKLIFSLDFPMVHPDIFQYYHLFSIPNENQSIIIPPATFLTSSNKEFQYQEEECTDLQPNFLCKKNLLLSSQENSDCITAILSTSTNLESCKQVPVHSEVQVIEEINESHYIGIFPNPEKVQLHCNQNDVAILKGTYLFTVPPSCSVSTSRYSYKNEKGYIKGHPLTLEEIDHVRIPIMQTEKLQLEKVPLDKFYQLQLQQLQEDPLENFQLQSYYHWSLSTLILIALICLAIFILYKRESILAILKKKTASTSAPLNETRVGPPLRSI